MKYWIDTEFIEKPGVLDLIGSYAPMAPTLL